MNKPKLQKLKAKAKQTLKILELIEKGLPIKEIALKAKCNRQVVDYYIGVTK